MALINGIYIHVTGEKVSRSVDASTHSVEIGADITDHIKPQPTELSLSGEIVSYTGYTSEDTTEQLTIHAWISLVKKDGSAFDTMSFDRLNNELLAFYGGANWADTGAIQYIDKDGNMINCNSIASSKIIQVKFEMVMPYASTVRIQNAVKQYCCFNIINKDTTGYNMRDYDADAESITNFALSNTYNGECGRIRTEFTNYDIKTGGITANETRTADWIISQLDSWLKSGALISYEGRNYAGNYQIRAFESDHPNTVTGGANFSMTIKEFRSAANSYTEGDGNVASGGTQQISQGENSEVWYEVQLGDSLYNLISQYGSLKRDPIDGTQYTTIDWIMQRNPHAFDDVNDCTTLKAYETILLGYR